MPRSAVSRRDWLRFVGAGAGGLAFACRDDDQPGPDDVSLAVLEPSSSGFVLSVWARHAASATVEIAHGDVIEIGTIAIDDSQTGALAVDELPPDTEHLVTLVLGNGLRIGPHRVRTAPRDDDDRPVTIAIGADFDPSDPAFDNDLVSHMLDAAPELFVSLGDFPYTDNGPPAQTLDEYRERHIQMRVDPRIRELFAAVGIRAMYDDHEFRNNWDASFVAAEADRYAAAIASWDEFFPLGNRSADPGEARYRRWRWGRNLECFLVDVRRFRSPNGMADGPTKTMLGTTQLAWLVDGLRVSTAAFKLVLTPVPLDFGSGDDGWHAFATERGTLFDAVVDLPGVLFVTADQHFFAHHRHAFGIREIQVGPIARGIPVPEQPRTGVLFRELDYNVGLVEAHPDRLVVVGLAPGGRRFFEQTFTVEDLTPRR